MDNTETVTKFVASPKLAVDLHARTVRHLISTPDVDEDGDVLLPRGCDISRFRKSNTVFDVHDYTTKSIIGQCMSIKQTDKGIEAVTRFSPRPPPDLLPPEERWEPDVLLWLYSLGDLKGFSVGFIGQDARNPTKADKENYGEQVKRVVTRWKLLEYSSTGLPNNAAAMTLSDKGLISQRLAVKIAAGELPTIDTFVEDIPQGKSEPEVTIAPEPPPTEQVVFVIVPPPQEPVEEPLDLEKTIRLAVSLKMMKGQGRLYL